MFMTTTQIAYWNMKEGKRHNKVTERETKRHNKVGEKETKRHNVAGENLTATDLIERNRHNVATENLTASDLAEKARHNRAGESIDLYRAQESERHNRVSEGQEQERIDISKMMTESNISVNDVNKELTRANIDLKQEDLKWYTVGLLAKSGKAGQAAALTKILGNDIVEAAKNYTDFVLTGSEAHKDFKTYTKRTVPKYRAAGVGSKGNGSSWYDELVEKLDIFDWTRVTG
jgi:hypothetical protein